MPDTAYWGIIIINNTILFLSPPEGSILKIALSLFWVSDPLFSVYQWHFSIFLSPNVILFDYGTAVTVYESHIITILFDKWSGNYS